jgi:hypothetical protein
LSNNPPLAGGKERMKLEAPASSGAFCLAAAPRMSALGQKRK